MKKGGVCLRGRVADQRGAAYDAKVLELVYTALLVVIFAVIGWFACYVVYKLYEGQR